MVSFVSFLVLSFCKIYHLRYVIINGKVSRSKCSDRFSLVVYCCIELEAPPLVRYNYKNQLERFGLSDRHTVVIFLLIYS